MPSIAPSKLFAAGLAVCALGVAACGGSDSGSTSTSGGSASSNAGGGYGAKPTTTTAAAAPSGAASTVKLAAAADGSLAFDPNTLTAKAGKVTLDMKNPQSSGIPHAVAVEGNGVAGSGEVAQPGGTSKVTVDLGPGTYTFYCPVPGHKAGGMEGTLTVS